ncbi:TPA: hypothetical protein N0F65_000382 [Lagenidium giganteum]|uniref:LicD/FKTN/FKRP nucleotidyltransferase domain-containing protein n=1 Tax=Lagenidium giganteum TaxID=4803 RepID=A0AAV2Z1A8_9STRA|nr:TPA: hypothetical protein N0F65_000382 [Lagenidium giganteum]
MIIGIIRNFHEFLDKHNINHWVDSGTLLGAVRDKGLIPYDVDADFGMDEPGYIFLRDNEVEVPEPYILNVWNSTMNDPGNRDEPLAVRFIHKKSGLYADMFVFKDDVDEEGKPVMGPPRSGCFGGCVRCPQDEDGGLFQVPDNWVFPVHMCKFEDFTVPCPHDSARYLDHLFGDDFMTHK